MKNKHILVTLLLGIIIVTSGSYLKIMHTTFFNINGHQLLSVGLFVELVAVVLLFVKLYQNKKVKQFLDS